MALYEAWSRKSLVGLGILQCDYKTEYPTFIWIFTLHRKQTCVACKIYEVRKAPVNKLVYLCVKVILPDGQYFDAIACKVFGSKNFMFPVKQLVTSSAKQCHSKKTKKIAMHKQALFTP